MAKKGAKVAEPTTITPEAPQQESTDVIKNRYQFMALCEVVNSQSNGDPDIEGRPRVNPDTGIGICTDVFLKSKMRRWVERAFEGKSPYRIYFSEKAVLNNIHAQVYQAVSPNSESLKAYNSRLNSSSGENGEEKTDSKDKKRKRLGEENEVELARKYLCQNFFDIRTTGGTMGTGLNCGQVTGPIQILPATSVDPVRIMELAITRSSVTREEDSIKQKGDNRTIGRKFIIPYGLFVIRGYIDPWYARISGMTNNDLEIFWKALAGMFEVDHGGAREINMLKIYAFKHDSHLGNYPSHQLFKKIQINKVTQDQFPSKFSDYVVKVDDNMPAGVTLLKVLE